MNGIKPHQQKKGKKSLFHSSNLPPHSWEAHPISKTATTNKTFIITIISLVAVVVLALLLFVTSQFVGKAFTVPGGHSVDVTLTAENKIRVELTLAGATTANGIYFELTSTTTGFDICDNIYLDQVQNDMWNEFYDISCSNEILHFSDATLSDDDLRGGTFIIAEFPLSTLPSDNSLGLRLNTIDVYDSSTGADLFPGGGNFEISVPACASDASRACGTDVGNCQAGAQTCLENGVWSECTGAIMPEAERCDESDNDCDAQTDEQNVCGIICREDTLESCLDQVSCTNANGVWNVISSVCTEQTVTERTLTVSSSAFTTGNPIPDMYTCNGQNTNPPLTIGNIPIGTESLIILLEDVDVDFEPEINPEIPLVHWAVWDIPVSASLGGSTVEIASGSLPAGADLGINEIDGSNSYSGPCPPAGQTHHYLFRVYALSGESVAIMGIEDINDIVPSDDPIVRSSVVEDNFEGFILAEGRLTGLYYPASVPQIGVPSGGGGGSSCRNEWSCPSQWSYCNALLQQSRTCTDINRCDPRKLTKLENRSCVACDESWTCTPWNACQNAQQIRSCTDEHSCGTAIQKPVLQKSCASAASGPAPVRIQPPLPAVQQPLPLPTISFWDTYKIWIVAIPSIVIAMALLALGAMHFLRSKPVEYNIAELKEWINKEQQMGTSNEDIKDILGQHTGWSKEDMEKTFGELKSAGKNSAG